MLAALPGCRAIATSSAGVARSLGFEDGEQAPADEMIGAAGRIAAAVELPVTGDLERGYGDPVGTARAAWEVGLSGINFEDSTGGAMVAVDEQVFAIRALRKAAPALVVNARIDVFLPRPGDVDEAVARGNEYLAAGADCVYPILCPADAIAELARRIDGPINVRRDARVAAAGRARAARRDAADVRRRARLGRLCRGRSHSRRSIAVVRRHAGRSAGRRGCGSRMRTPTGRAPGGGSRSRSGR